MSYNDLRDLELAGVKWELADAPIAAVRTSATPTNDEKIIESSRRDAASVVMEFGRGGASVVPPVAPVQTMSMETVRAMAARPNDMAALNRMIGEFNHPLRSTATNTVLPHVGNGKLMILTDIPGSDDDATGQVLSGAAGELMDKMLAAIGLNRMSVSILPMIFWRTPGGRTPSRQEIDMSRPFVDRAIELLAPRVILTLGTLPASEMAQINLARNHGLPIDMPNGATLVPIYHPNYLILKPAAKREVWTALQNVENILKSAE